MRSHMRYSVNSLKGLYSGLYMGSTIGLIQRDARSLDHAHMWYTGSLKW